MSVDIEHRGVFGSLGHPILAKLGAPGKRVLLVGQMLQLAAYRAHFRSPIDAEQFSPLSRRMIAQGFDRFDPSQRHESQQQKDRLETIEAGRQAEVFVRMAQQSADQQRGQRQQNPAMRKIDGPVETRLDLLELSKAGRHPFQRRRGPTTHRRGAIDFGSLAFRARRYPLPPPLFFLGGANPARRHRLLQRVQLQAKLLGDLRQARARDEEALDLSHHAGGQHRWPARWPRCIKALRAPFSIKLHRTLHADRGDPESPDDVALLRIPTFTKLARDHAKGRDVVLRMDKHRHVAVEVRDLAVPPFKGQFVGDVGYPSGKHRQMTLRHNTVSPVETTELRPAPGSFLYPIERVTYRPSRPPSFAQPIDANRYFDGPSLHPEGRRSGGLDVVRDGVRGLDWVEGSRACGCG